MEVYNRDLEEVQDDGLLGHNQTYGIEPEATDCCFIRVGLCHDVSSDYWVLDVPNEHKTRYLICCEHIEPVLDGSKTCSPDGCKAYSEVPKGYS